MGRHFYLETDGQVFLVREDGKWRFPRRAELPCRYEPVYAMRVDGEEVMFGRPRLHRHPFRWSHKDDLIGRPDVDPLVQKAVNRTLTRCAAKVLIEEKGRVLLVRGRRGLTKGIWNLPGGFVGYTESPAQSALRELKEELGIRGRIRRLIGVYTATFPSSAGHMISFVYEARRLPGRIRPCRGEIAAWRWEPIRRAEKIIGNPFAAAAIRDYLCGRRRSQL